MVATTYGKDLRESPYSPQAMELGLGLLHHVTALLLDGVTGLRSARFDIPREPLPSGGSSASPRLATRGCRLCTLRRLLRPARHDAMADATP